MPSSGKSDDFQSPQSAIFVIFSVTLEVAVAVKPLFV
jgi:hypothetical protein